MLEDAAFKLKEMLKDHKDYLAISELEKMLEF